VESAWLRPHRCLTLWRLGLLVLRLLVFAAFERDGVRNCTPSATVIDAIVWLCVDLVSFMATAYSAAE